MKIQKFFRSGKQKGELNLLADKEWLLEQSKIKSPNQIAKMVGVSNSVVTKHMDHFGIARMSIAESKKLTHSTTNPFTGLQSEKSWWVEQYVNQKRSKNSLAKELSVDKRKITTTLKFHSIGRNQRIPVKTKHVPKPQIQFSVGDSFNRWTILSRVVDTDTGKLAGWEIQCTCGSVRQSKNITSIVNGTSVSCGCYRIERLKTHNVMFDSNVRDRVSKSAKANPQSAESIQKRSKAAQTPAVQERRAETNKIKYGGKSPACSSVVQDKIKQTNQDRYGVDCVLSCPEVRQKGANTQMERYGVDNHMRDPARAAVVGKKISEAKAPFAFTFSNGETLVAACRANNKLASSVRNILRVFGSKIAEEWVYAEKKGNSALETYTFQQLDRAGLSVEYFDRELPELKNINSKFRPDFKLSYKNKEIYVESDGLYMHSIKNILDKNRHKTKFEKFQELNIAYLQFRQDELLDNMDIVVGLIKSKLGMNSTIYARKTIFATVKHKEACEFLQANHIMGSMNGVSHRGLYSKDGELLMMMSSRIQNHELDISRVVSKIGITVVGGLSKLLANIDKTNVTSIKSYVDCRYADGHSLEKLGFDLVSTTLGWKWTNGVETFNRRYCRANMDHRGLKEAEHAQELKVYKIYDAGQRKFVKQL